MYAYQAKPDLVDINDLTGMFTNPQVLPIIVIGAIVLFVLAVI